MRKASERNRVIGVYKSNIEGPVLLITAAVHGNEPSGIRALEKVFKILNTKKPSITGTVIGIIGNKMAVQNQMRYIDEDLNRTWTNENLNNKIVDSQEKKEMFEIIELLKYYKNNYNSSLHFIDCHTTSSESLPFISVQQVGENESWASQFPIHNIIGFSDLVNGTIDGYLSKQGITGFVLEAGHHNSAKSIIYHEGIIWMALEKLCALNYNDLGSVPDAVIQTLQNTPSQKRFEIVHRYGLKNDDDFEMEKGFENFQPIKKGEHLATLNGIPVYSLWDAYIFMPLYQAQGNDGFFVIKEISN